MDREAIRNMLNEENQQLFDQIVTSAVLGAGNHIRMIGNIILNIARSEEATIEDKKQEIEAVSEFFKATRGKSSYAFINAMNIMTSFLNKESCTSADMQVAVLSYDKGNEANCERIITYAKRAAAGCRTIMLYDYSSTVEKFVTALEPGMIVYLPESRTIDGGRPFIEPLKQAGHDLRYIPDACMMSVLKECDAVFIGAETLYPDGTSFNTAGSDILAVLCKEFKIPYYVLTPLLKTDMRAMQGIYKDVIAADLKSKLTAGWKTEQVDAVDCYSIELVGVKPQYITAVITETGILPPAAVYTEALAYQERITKGVSL